MERRFSLTLEINKSVQNSMFKRTSAEAKIEAVPSYQTLSSHTSIPEHTSSKDNSSQMSEEDYLVKEF